MPPEAWIGIGTLLLLIGTGMVTWGNVLTSKIISDATVGIKDATDNLQTQTQRIEGINNAIANRSEQISKYASEGLNQLTGGDSFCYISASGQPTDNTISLTLFHSGRYTLKAYAFASGEINIL